MDDTSDSNAPHEDIVLWDGIRVRRDRESCETVDGWETVSDLLRGSSLGIFSLCAAIAPPLMRFGHEEGTFFTSVKLPAKASRCS